MAAPVRSAAPVRRHQNPMSRLNHPDSARGTRYVVRLKVSIHENQGVRVFSSSATRSSCRYPAQPLLQGAVGNLKRPSPTTMGAQNPECRPLLLISGQQTSFQTSRRCRAV